ncbi:MAG: CotH kinase family protein, partial [Myxococcales bacterium]|nr:CotH kinase family protein [Myxococcales bacterium]
CDDGQSCTSGDTCKAGKCSGGGQVGCDDGNPCTKDACTASSGKPVCTHQAITGACSDGDACTANDQCAGGVCVSGKAKACTDDNACTTDACDAKTGKCSHGTAGSDGLVCKSGVGACGPAACAKGECVALSKSPCNDDNGCTDDICDKGKGCKHPANTAPCSDNNVCTTADKCAGGACKSGAPRDCDDNNICTLDKCVPSLGTATGCQHTEQAVANCDDGDKCTSEDTCKKGKCKGKKKDCGDDEECTLDTCKDGVCSHDNNAKNGKSCKVHKWCWGYGTCGKGVCIDKPGTCPAKKWQQMWPIVPLKKLRKATTLFDPLGYHVVKVTLPPANWAAYLHQVLTNKKGKTYHKATIDFDGDVYPDIGIRPFGFGSQFYNPSKPNIRMNFDYYDDDAVGPYKRRNIRLKASGQDRAFLKQPLSQSLVQLAGGNAPRWSWARVFVNGQPFGLYQVFEHVDKRFFNANFGNTKGNDYEPSPICRGFNCPSAGCSDLAKYYTKDPGQALEIVALAKVVKDAPDKSWLVDAGKIIAWGPLLAQYAIEAILSDFDSLAAAGNNYELYVNKDTGKMQIIPGGMDLNFGRANSWYDIYKIWGLPNKWCKGRVDHLYQRIVKTAQSKADLDKVINQVRCGPFSNAVLLTLIDGMKVMLADDLYNDPKGIASKNVIDSEFVKLKAYITKRNAYLQGIYGDCP